MTKPRLDSFAEKISAAQTQQLIEWLAEHTYSEICDLVATEPPDGFGLQVSISTICRFHKAHFAEVTDVRQEKLNLRAADQQHYADHLNDFYRKNLSHGTTLSLQERLYEILTRPVENVNDLKKLVHICKEMKNLEIPLDPKEARKDELLRKLTGHPLDAVKPLFRDKLEAMRKAAMEEGNDILVKGSQPSASQ